MDLPKSSPRRFYSLDSSPNIHRHSQQEPISGEDSSLDLSMISCSQYAPSGAGSTPRQSSLNERNQRIQRNQSAQTHQWWSVQSLPVSGMLSKAAHPAHLTNVVRLLRRFYASNPVLQWFIVPLRRRLSTAPSISSYYSNEFAIFLRPKSKVHIWWWSICRFKSADLRLPNRAHSALSLQTTSADLVPRASRVSSEF